MLRLTLTAAALLALLPGLRAETLRVPADHPTIQGALNAASHGDEVLISSGTYVEDLFVIDVEDLTIRAKGKVVLTAESTAPGAWTLGAVGCDRLQLIGLRFETDGVCAGATVQDARGLLVADCRFDDVWTGLHVESLEGLVVRDCRFSGGFTAITLSGVERGRLSGNSIRSVQNYGVHVQASNTLEISDNDLRDTSNAVFLTGAPFAVSVADNRFRDSPRPITLAGNDHTVSGNRIKGSAYAIVCGSSSSEARHVVRDNTIVGAGMAAIAVNGTESLVAGNTIRGTLGSAIYLGGQQNIASHNDVSGCGVHGIYVAGTSIAVLSNRVRKTGDDTIELGADSGHVVLDNDVDDNDDDGDDD